MTTTRLAETAISRADFGRLLAAANRFRKAKGRTIHDPLRRVSGAAVYVSERALAAIKLDAASATRAKAPSVPSATSLRTRRGANAASAGAEVQLGKVARSASTNDFAHLNSRVEDDPAELSAQIVAAAAKARSPTSVKPPAAGTLARRIIDAGKKRRGEV